MKFSANFMSLKNELKELLSCNYFPIHFQAKARREQSLSYETTYKVRFCVEEFRAT